ncbi:MAG: 3'-5' exonuclease domain-containing protein 2 [Bacteroidales bacterium]|nr:3'-5' exonuclease domain-containing protein 2 [Bacteroidales bacterium]
MSFKESISHEEIEELELLSFDGKIEVITDTGAAYKKAIKHLSSCRMIGFDTETKPVFQHHVPHNPTALLQLSSETNAYIFRLTKIGMPKELVKLMTSKTITKIGAAVWDDIRGLNHYSHFEAQRFMDLQSFAENYGIKDKSVKKLTAIILGRKVSKAQQLSNWESPELTQAQLLYAATDAWVCLVMYKKLLAS